MLNTLCKVNDKFRPGQEHPSFYFEESGIFVHLLHDKGNCRHRHSSRFCQKKAIIPLGFVKNEQLPCLLHKKNIHLQ